MRCGCVIEARRNRVEQSRGEAAVKVADFYGLRSDIAAFSKSG